MAELRTMARSALDGPASASLSGMACFVEALDAFPGQASDAALLDEDADDLRAGLQALLDEGAASVTLLVPEGASSAVFAARFSFVDVRPVPRMFPLDDVRALRVWLALPQGTPLIRAATVAARGRESRGRVSVHRWVSVVGAVAQPSTWFVPLGTPFGRLVDLCGGGARRNAIPFRTRPITFSSRRDGVEPDDAVIVVIPRRSSFARNRSKPLGESIRRITAGCSRCGLCEEICPVRVDGPHPLQLADALRWSEDRNGPSPPANAANCLGCGLCETICPSALPIGRVSHEVGERVRATGVAPAVRGLRLVPLDGLARTLGIAGDATRREDGRDSVFRVRRPLRQRDGRRAQVVAREGRRVWTGETLAHVPGSTTRIVAPFTGRILIEKDHLFIERDAG